MASASSQSNPATVLEDAVADFRSALTAEEQIRLDIEQKGGLPDSSAAFAFTASLDKINAAKRKGQSIASRLFSLIQTVQQFTNIIDTYVSANPEVSALVWSSMKLTLMIIVNVLSYFEAFSKLFLRFEGLRPRFEEYSFLFPGSKRLQTALCHFHASIIKCCREAIVISRRPWRQHVFHVLFSSFQSEMQPFIQDIELKAKEVKGEIALAKAQADRDERQLQEHERKEASRYRLQLTRFLSKSTALLNHRSLDTDDWRKEIDYRRSTRRKRELLDALSMYDYMAAFKQARRRRFPNTCQWFEATPEFATWYQSNVSSTLILSGKIGAGKTVLTGSILDFLFQHASSDTCVLFYHVCFDKAESLQAETLIRSILRQNLDPESISDELNTSLIAAENAMFDFASLNDLLERKLLESKTTYIVIDGVDELSIEEEKAVTSSLKNLMKHPQIMLKLLLSSRDGRLNDLRKRFPRARHLSLHGDGANEDIKHYITQVIDQRIEDGDLVVGDKALIGEIRAALTKGAQGMFLWVALEIEDVCFQSSDAAIRAVLEDLPKDLTGTFNRAVRRILVRGKSNKETAIRILKIMTAAKRPLELVELAEAAATEIGQEYWKPGQELNNVVAIPTWCENLVTVDEESQLVHFIHHTVKKFLLQGQLGDSELGQFHFSPEEASHLLGQVCVTYLGLNDFKTAIIKRLEPLPVLDPKIIVTSALKSRWKSRVAENLGALVSKGYHPKSTDSACENRVESVARLEAFRSKGVGAFQETPPRGQKQFGPFLYYAATYWLQHTEKFTKPGQSGTTTDPKCWALFLEMITGTHHVAQTPWTEDEFDSLSTKVIMWADSYRHIALLRHLLLDRWDLDDPDLPRWPLVKVLGLLVSRPEYVVGGLFTSFRASIHLGHIPFVELYGKALAESVICGFPTQPTLPLADRDVPCDCKSTGSRPLQGELCDAVKFGVPDGFTFSKLMFLAAAWYGNRATLRAHLHLGDIAHTSRDGKTALHLAAEAGHLRAVKELVAGLGERSLHLKTLGSNKTPLHLAVDKGHHDVSRFILSQGGGNSTAKDDGPPPIAGRGPRLSHALVETKTPWPSMVTSGQVGRDTLSPPGLYW